MTEFPDQGELSYRQQVGRNYLEYNRGVPTEVDLQGKSDVWLMRARGRAQSPPEMELNQACMVIFYNLDLYIITNRETGKNLDLLKITPERWLQRAVQPTSYAYISPEQTKTITNYFEVDDEKWELLTGDFPRSDRDLDVSVGEALWMTLIARFIEEMGIPANDEANEAMVECVKSRRKEILDALSGTREEDPAELAIQPFTTS